MEGREVRGKEKRMGEEETGMEKALERIRGECGEGGGGGERKGVG